MTQEDINKVKQNLPTKKVFGEIAHRLEISESTVRKCFKSYDDENMGHVKIIQTAVEIIDEITLLNEKVKTLA